MSTLDVVALAGGRAANFCDLGGGGDAEGVVDALEIITGDPQVKSILFNVFGGITRTDEVARGILQALERMTIEHPIVVRLDGTNAVEGRKLLAEAAPPTAIWGQSESSVDRFGCPQPQTNGSRASTTRRRIDPRVCDDRRLVGPRRGLPAEPGAPGGSRPRPDRRVGGGREDGARRRDR